MTIIGVKVLPRSEVLDSQGRAVEKNLSREAFAKAQVRVGKYLELHFDLDREQALSEAKKMAEWGLYNPLIETYQLEMVSR